MRRRPTRSIEPYQIDGWLQKALVVFNLFGCPKCKTEAIISNVSAWNGKEWKDVPALKTRRDLSSGVSLRDQFA
jgi:hypothetical protein